MQQTSFDLLIQHQAIDFLLPSVKRHLESDQWKKLFHQALKKGQLQTASQVLDSIGRVIGESVETVNIQAPELKISIEDKGD